MLMNNEPFNVAHWYVIHTHPKQESRVAKNLTMWQVENLSPMIRVDRYDTYTNRPMSQIRPLFPSYIFARFIVGNMLAKIRFTRGVRDVVNFGNGPTPVADDLIQLIQSRVGKEGLVELDEKFQEGDQVRISGGPLNGLTGVFEREANDAARVMILLETISFQARTSIPKQMVEKIRASW